MVFAVVYRFSYFKGFHKTHKNVIVNRIPHASDIASSITVSDPNDNVSVYIDVMSEKVHLVHL